MSKFVEATCQAGVITADGVTVEGDILSQGTKASNGLLLMQAEKMKYLTSNASDIHDVIEKVDAVFGQLETVLSAIDAVTTAPGSSAAAIAAIAALRVQLTSIKDNLK